MLNAIFIGITLLIIMGVGLLFHVFTKITPEEGWCAAIMVVLCAVYIAGLAGNTQIALVVIYLLAAAGLIAGGIAWAKGADRTIITFFSPGIVMIIAVAGVGVIAFQGMHICNWDELYQWGKAANYMVEFDKLPNGSDFSGEALLLSSTTFFHYFFSKISALFLKTITESNYYVSNLVLWFSALLLPFSGEGWKSCKRVWGFGLFHFMLTALIFVQPYYNIYTDQATAYWAGGLIAWLMLKKYNKHNLYLVPLILLNVGMMKSMVGPLFAVIVVMAVIVLYCTGQHEKKEPVLPGKWKQYLFSKYGLIGCLVILSPIVFTLIWSAITGKNGIFRFNGGMEEGQDNRLVLTLKSMISWIFKAVNLHDERIYLSYGTFILITIGVVCIVYPFILDREELPGYRNLMYVYIGGFGGYFLIMFFAYLTVFGYVDSIRAMSLNRYFSDYMMLGIVPLTVPLFSKNGKDKRAGIAALKKSIILMALLCIVYGSSDYFLPQLAHIYAVDKNDYAEREKFVKYAKKVKEITEEKGKIYFINQSRSGLYTLVADYEMGDQLSRGGMCFNFREDTSEPVLGLTEYSIETLPEVLKEEGYEYLWIYSTDDYFTENMNEIFGIEKVKKGDFYRVISSGKEVKLDYLENVQ